MEKNKAFEITKELTSEINKEVRKLYDTEPFQQIIADLAYDIVIVAEYLKHKQLQQTSTPKHSHPTGLYKQKTYHS